MHDSSAVMADRRALLERRAAVPGPLRFRTAIIESSTPSLARGLLPGPESRA